MPNQANWHWCNKCQGLFFAGNSLGVCPAYAGAHALTGPGSYELWSLTGEVPDFEGSYGFHWCQKCQGLFFDDSGSPGVCPGGPNGHDASLSGCYFICEYYFLGNQPVKRSERLVHLYQM
jgi:hypothetical protein